MMTKLLCMGAACGLALSACGGHDTTAPGEPSVTIAVQGSAEGATPEIAGTRLLARATRCTALDQCQDEYGTLGTGAIDSTGHYRVDIPWLVLGDAGVHPVIIEVVVQSRDAGRASYNPAIDTVLVDTRIDTAWVHVDLVAGP